MRSVGGNAGGLTAVSTFGSFAGTVLIGYVLIPLFSNSTTMFGAAFVLVALALGYFLVWGRTAASTTMTAAAAVIVAAAGLAGLRVEPWHTEKAYELARRNSNFGQLQVIQLKNPSCDSSWMITWRKISTIPTGTRARTALSARE